jgi:hypothetical protein
MRLSIDLAVDATVHRFSRVIMTGLSMPGRFAPKRNHSAYGT